MTTEQAGNDSQGISRSLALVEQIAHFRASLELDMMQTEWNPQSWQRAYEARLEQYPQIYPYKAIFDGALEIVQGANSDLNQLWRRRCGPKRDLAGDSRLEETGGFSAKNLYFDVLNLDPIGSPEAIKGMFTLRFMVDDQDFKSICRKHGSIPEITAALKIPPRDFRFWALVINKERPAELIDEDTLHELEHAKNALLIRSRRVMLYANRSVMPHAAIRRIQRRELLDSEEMMDAKDELLAYFTVFEHADSNLKREDMYSQLSQWFPKIAGLAIRSVGGSEEGDKLEDYVVNGLRALSGLFKVYAQAGYNYYEATRLSINILEQFPLSLWPTTARLLFRKYNVSYKQPSDVSK